MFRSRSSTSITQNLLLAIAAVASSLLIAAVASQPSLGAGPAFSDLTRSFVAASPAPVALDIASTHLGVASIVASVPAAGVRSPMATELSHTYATAGLSGGVTLTGVQGAGLSS